jgi:hypothetical protein
VSGANRIEQGIDIGAIRLVATQIRFHIPHREQRHAVSMTLCDATPMVRRPARFHHHVCRWVLSEEASELSAIQAAPLAHLPATVSDADFEHGR